MLSLFAASTSFTAGSAVAPSSVARAPAASMGMVGLDLIDSRSKIDIITGMSTSMMVGKVVPTNVPTKTTETAAPAPVSKAEVLECQAKWAAAIAKISAVYLEEGDFVGAAGEAAGELYGYGHGPVLFKPTKATGHPFRDTPEIAMSYFVGSEAMSMPEFDGEDAGFAINGGKGWKKVVFSNHQVDLHGPVAIAMGSYDFTCASTGDVATVQYTFGYKRCADGKPRICLHHSSVPYGPSCILPYDVEDEE